MIRYVYPGISYFKVNNILKYHCRPHFGYLFGRLILAIVTILGSHVSIPDWSLENHISGLKDAMGKRHVLKEYSAKERIFGYRERERGC